MLRDCKASLMASLSWLACQVFAGGVRGVVGWQGVDDSNTCLCVNTDERWQWALDNLIDKSIALADYAARLLRPFRIKYLCIPPQPFALCSLCLLFVCLCVSVCEWRGLSLRNVFVWSRSMCVVVNIKTYFHFPIHKYIILSCHTGIVVI